MMLELDRHGNWWLDGSIIEFWEITEKWTEMVNACEVLADKLTATKTLVREMGELLKYRSDAAAHKILNRDDVKAILKEGE